MEDAAVSRTAFTDHDITVRGRDHRESGPFREWMRSLFPEGKYDLNVPLSESNLLEIFSGTYKGPRGEDLHKPMSMRLGASYAHGQEMTRRLLKMISVLNKPVDVQARAERFKRGDFVGEKVEAERLEPRLGDDEWQGDPDRVWRRTPRIGVQRPALAAPARGLPPKPEAIEGPPRGLPSPPRQIEGPPRGLPSPPRQIGGPSKGKKDRGLDR